MPTRSSSPVIIVTGASKGLGLSITRILISTFNSRVIAISRSRSIELDGLIGSNSSSSSSSSSQDDQQDDQSKPNDQPKSNNTNESESIIYIQGDITDPTIPIRAVNAGLKQWGRLDGVVLNAGTIDPLGPISDPSNTSTQWSESFSTNLFSIINMLQASTPHLRRSPASSTASADEEEKKGAGQGREQEEGGNVVFVSSGAATGNTAGWGCYNATKAALNSLCRTFANEERSIASFSVRPGMVNTAMQTKLRANGGKGMLPEEMERFVNAHKEGKLLKPEDPGYVIAALAVNGQQVRDLSGQFLSWNDASLAAYQRPQ